MNLIENEQMYKKLNTLKNKIKQITTVTDEQKEINQLITELLESSITMLDDLQETMEI